MSAAPQSSSPWKALLGFGLVVVGAFHLLILIVSPSILLHCYLGFLFFLADLPARIRFHPASILTFVLASIGFLFLLHKFLRDPDPDSAVSNRHAFRLSLLAFLSLLVSFTAGLAFTGTMHQIGWLIREGEPLDVYRYEQANRFRTIGVASHAYLDAYRRFPPGGTTLPAATPGHSWMTLLLPYGGPADLVNQIDLHRSWRDPVNKPPFSQSLYLFWGRPTATPQDFDPEGYAYASIAGNLHVLKTNIGLTSDDISDGLSNTILAGEVGSRYKPWADPTNLRDPARGINRDPNGFGARWPPRGAEFLMTDGGARMINPDIDPQILRALATPNGGETISGDY